MNRGLTASIVVCVAAAGVAVGALTLDAGGGNDGQATAQATGAGEASGSLIIDDFTFSAAAVEPGGTVTVENQDNAQHTVTAADSSFDTGTIDPSGTITFTAPTGPGTYQFNCQIHPEMSGTLTVQAAAGAEAPPGEGTGTVEVTTTTITTAPPTTQVSGGY